MIAEDTIEDKSNARIIAELGLRYREYRLHGNITQKEVSRRSGVSVFTISQFEKGDAHNITLSTLLSLLRSINQLKSFDDLLPQLPPIPHRQRAANK